MGQKDDLLEIISKREGPAKPADLAVDMRLSEASIRSYVTSLKKKGLVDGDAKVGWFITDKGKESLEKPEVISTTVEDVGQDELSKFKRFGDLAVVDHNLIDACSEAFQNLDMRNMDEMKRVMAEFNVPQTARQRWEANYRGYLRNTTPPEKRDELYPVPEAVVKPPESGKANFGVNEAGEPTPYYIEGNDIHRAPEGLGEFTFREAIQVVAAKRGTGAPPKPQDGGASMFSDFADAVSKLNPNKPLTVTEILDIAEAFKKKEEEGGNSKPPAATPGYFVNEEGELQELKPGQPIVIKKVEHQAGKTFVMDGQGNLIEQEPGKPIVIKVNSEPHSENPLAMMPFPVMGTDGLPVYDKEGKPVFANIEPMLKFMGYQSSERRADERHHALLGLTKVIKENIGDGVQALKDAAADSRRSPGAKDAAADSRRSPGAKEAAEEERQKCKCGVCEAEFLIPNTPFERVACPNCGQEYSREEILRA